MRKRQAGLNDPAPKQASPFYGTRVIHLPGGIAMTSAPSYICHSLSAYFWVQNDTLTCRDRNRDHEVGVVTLKW